MDLQVGVKVFIKNKEGNFLILKRNVDQYKEVKNLWDIPGGRIKSGFSLFDNLKREVKEETNLDLLENLKLVFAQDIIRKDKHVVRLTYIGEADGQFVLDNTENVDFRWVSLKELKELRGFCEFAKEVLDKGFVL